MSLGRMNTRITIQSPTEKVEHGNTVTTWQDVKQVWSQYNPRIRDYYANGVYIQERNAVFTVYYDSSILPNYRIIHNEQEYDITSIEPDAMKVRMVIRTRGN